MLRGLWTVLATSLTLAVIGLSMAMNFAFGYGLGTSPVNARILGALSVTCDGLKALLPLFVAWQWAERRRLPAATGLLLFALLLAYGTASAIGFAAENRTSMIGTRDSRSADFDVALADRALAAQRQVALPTHKLPGVVEAEIAALQKDRVWDATRGCTDATLPASRAFCKQIDQLRAELAIGREHAALSARIERLNAQIQQAREGGAGREPDPQAAAITLITGLDTPSIRSGLTWLLAIAVEAISAFGLFAISRGVPRAPLSTHRGPPANNPSQRATVTTSQPATGWRLIRAG